MKNKKLAQEVLKTLKIYGPYVTRFGTEGPCFYEGGIGYWAHQEEKLQKVIDELEASENVTVYGVVHSVSNLGELWDVYALDNDAQTVDEVIDEAGPGQYYAYARCYDGNFEYIESGDEVIAQRFGGIIRIG